MRERDQSATGAASRNRAALSRPLCIVAFHRIAANPADELSYAPARFRRLCAWWRETADVIPLASCFQPAAGATLGTAERLRLAITFDDGYADNALVAAEILADLGLTATFFLPSAWIGLGRSFPWDAAYAPPPPVMDWAQARQLAAAGFGIGSHTCTHARLAACEPARRESELRDSRRELEQRLGVAVVDFAYPYGGREDCREEDRQAVVAAGYRCCLSCYGGLTNMADPWHGRRIAISPRWHASPRAWRRQLARAERAWRVERLAAGVADSHRA